MKQKIQKIASWIKTHRTKSLIIGGVLLVLIASGAAYGIYAATAPEKISIPPITVKKKPVKKYYSPLTGVEVADEATTKRAVTAIMLENSPDARPQSGLKDAGVVYEAIAEGGITRFLALYQEARPSLIGPVRSLRMYYLDWAAPYNSSIAHIGGSKAALDEVRNGSYRDIDQFFNADTYWRANDRYAPHNVYTNFDRLDALNQTKGYTNSSFTGFERGDGKPAKTANATAITINFSSALFNTSYQYDPTTNSYLRSVGGEAHIDREKGQLSPNVVVALDVTMTHVMEDGWREQIETNGSGVARVFQNGTITEGTWKKEGRISPLQLVDATGNSIKLNPGQTWIAAVPVNSTGSVSW